MLATADRRWKLARAAALTLGASAEVLADTCRGRGHDLNLTITGRVRGICWRLVLAGVTRYRNTPRPAAGRRVS